MIGTQLGPPPAVASRRGSAPTGAGGESATITRSDADDGDFTAALEGHQNPASSETRPAEAHTPRDAAGPPRGELQGEDAADVGASHEESIAAASVAAVIADAITTVVSMVAPSTPPSGALAGMQAKEVVQAGGLRQPLAGLVPARLDGNGGVTPALTPAQVQAQVQAQAQAAASGTGASVGQAPALGAPAADAAIGVAPASSGTTAVPAATLTLSITPTPAPAAIGDDAVAVPVPVLGQGLTAPSVAQATTAMAATTAEDAAQGVPTPRAQVQEAVAAAAKASDAPAGTVAPVPVAAPAQVDPLGAIVRSGGGLTTPHELARELGSRVHMAVREGGRELVVNLRPPELGHLTIRVTIIDGVLQAQIIADRPEAARMLQQSMAHLDSALGDLGYSLDNLDVAYGGQDSRDAQAASARADAPVQGEVLEPDGSPAVGGINPSAASGSPAGLDILA